MPAFPFTPKTPTTHTAGTRSPAKPAKTPHPSGVKRRLLKDKDSISNWLMDRGAKNFSIAEDLQVSFLKAQRFEDKNIKYFPFDFKEIKDSFSVKYCMLKTLEGLPPVIEGDFFCNSNLLTTLEGGPSVVKGTFLCDNNELTNLIGGPVVVEQSYTCKNNKLTSLEGFPKTLRQEFHVSSNPTLKTIKGMKPIFQDNGIFMFMRCPIKELREQTKGKEKMLSGVEINAAIEKMLLANTITLKKAPKISTPQKSFKL